MFSERVRLVVGFFAAAGVLALIYLPVFSKYQELKRKELEITEEIARLGEIVRRLAREEKLMESDVNYLEKVARENLGRVRPGEVVYKIMPVTQQRESKGEAREHGNLVVSTA